jgi:hypothetical protein
MTKAEAQSLLNRVRAGDKTPTMPEINLALIVCGDICAMLSPVVCDE